MEGATHELRSLLRALARAVEWQAELGAHGVPRVEAIDPRPTVVATSAARPTSTAEAKPDRGQNRPSPVTPRPAPPLPETRTTAAPSAPTAAAAEAGPRLTLEAIRAELGDCERCKLCTGRRNIVYGVGSPDADLMFVGEAPGRDEDLQGIPFVGRAGQLLTRMIRAMGLTRDDVYIANIIKCRPPRNRDPEQDEIVACEPFLLQQIDAIRPKVLVSLGRVSAQTLLRVKTPISRLRGRWRDYHGVKLMPTFHPAYLLRSPDKKREAWEDLQAVMAELDLERPERA